jgi:hypothetical protein
MTYVKGKNMTVESGIKSLSEEIADVTHTDEEEIAQVGGDKNVVWRVMFNGLLELASEFMRRRISIIFVYTEAKLQMISRNDLF